MQVHCAWCEQEGRPSLMRTAEGAGVSHGICPEHAAALRREIQRQREARPA
jgi:hypothetical protein